MNYTIDLLNAPDLLRLPEPRWLITDHIHEQEVGVFYGPPNVGKSFVALDWALSIAAGVPWLGVYPTMRTPVLYMAGEGGASLQKRVDAWFAIHPDVDVPSMPIWFQCRPLPLIDDEAVNDLQDVLAGFQSDERTEPGLEPGFIVIDTLSQFLGGGDENGPDMAAFVANARALSQNQNAAVLIVHHTNKGGVQERGHTALRGNVDVMYSITGKEQEGLLIEVQLLNDKQRDNPRARPRKLAISSSHQSLVISGEISHKLPQVPLEISSESLIDLLLWAGRVEDPEKETFNSEAWRIESGLNPSSYARYRNNLLSLKAIRGAGHGKYAFTPRGRETYHWHAKKVKKG